MQLRAFVLPLVGLLLPLLMILIGMVLDVTSVALYVGAMIWFGLGLIFIVALSQ